MVLNTTSLKASNQPDVNYVSNVKGSSSILLMKMVGIPNLSDCKVNISKEVFVKEDAGEDYPIM